ncbi:PREDICTED: glutamine and serine-rich protein 1 isoform X1 [Sturnus vulgaris]|uniref:glutamine and serine-rich protein 1 isoform X1 n=2 Tax=Sturnus vulgaris TaxID=9172 RepID=UPI00071A6DC1|nr:PREDICTED: glutamine and serine-rich protein 1 isoform X1 [Sturnus vulgaris]XP_014740074.1 PREDICTED: glutamine and serine-rich protein 1 isoform X1 [Sturnus vulgaris]
MLSEKITGPPWDVRLHIPCLTENCKDSLSYGGGHSSHSETELHRQTYTAPHQLPGYSTTQHPAGLSGIFDTSMHSAGGNTKETSSVMNFLSAIESRTAQAVSSGSTLLPQFRAPSWQTGMHSSTATELFVTGALPTSGTFPPTSALSAYQHPNTFSSRNFATTPSLTLQDATFSATSNGLLSAHDPLLQIKTSQGTVPTALTFERLGSSVLSTSVPPQSSTYRSAQESAPHLLQPQFSLLPSTLGGAQQVSQAYSTSVFTGSTASMDRALQRECSVIKHHQRPSSTQSVQPQLTVSQHSLHNYLTSTSGVNFQDTSRHSALSCSPVGDVTQVSNGGPQQKTSQVTVELAQSYTSAIPSPGFPSASTAKVKNCSMKQPPRSTKTPKPQSVAPTVQTQSYAKTAQNQSSVITGQAQIYSTAQLPSLLSVSQSQNYVSCQAQNVPPVSHSQDFSSSKVEKLPSLYKTLTFSGQSQAITSDSQTLNYSSEEQVLTSVPNENYSGQMRELSSVSQAQSYSSSHSQGLSPVTQSQVNFSSQSQVLAAVSPSESYSSGQSLTLTSPSLSFNASPRVQTLPASSPNQSYISLHSSQNSQSQESSSPQSQKFLPSVQSPFASPAHSQALQNNRPSSETKSYVKRKSDSNLYASSKQEEELSMQDMQALQQQATLESSTQSLTEEEISAQDASYRVSKANDRYSQSVIRSNSRLEDQVVGLTLQGTKKDERMVSSVEQLSQNIGHISSLSHDIKKTANLMRTAQGTVSAKELNQQHSLMHKVHESKAQEQQGQVISTPPQVQPHALRHGHQLCLPSAQVLLESTCDLQILHQSILQSGLGQAKASPQVQRIQSPQQVTHPFLQMDGHIVQSNGGHSQQQLHSQNSEVMKMDISESSKPLQQHLTAKDHFTQTNQHDAKNQFVSLSSICFPESILLSDERNILSNVDDILAATAAACGVTPSDFAKSASNEEEIQTVENSEESKTQFRSLDSRHVSSVFSASPTVVGKPAGRNNISLNGGQITLNLTPVSTIQTKTVNLDQQHLETSDQSVPIRMTSPTLGPGQEEQEAVRVKKQSSISHESEEDNDASVDGTLNARDTEFVSSGRSLSEESAASENDFNVGGDDGTVAGNQSKVPLQPLSVPQSADGAINRTEEECQDLAQGNLQKKKSKGKSQNKNAAEDDSATQKQVKRSGQCKRQNSRGNDSCFTYSSPVSEGCYDTYQHQERMRQKIKEVEEKQPEVRTGFIASFLDFLKSGPRQQFSTPAVRMPNRTRRPVTQIVRAPCLQPSAKPQPAAAPPVAAEVSGESPTKKADEELKKNLETLPSFSSDEDDSVGGNHDLQKSISTALSALDETSDKKIKSETEKVTAVTAAATTTSAVIKQESPQTTAPVGNVQEKMNSADPLKVAQQEAVSSEQLAKIQETVAIEGCTDEENMDSEGEGMYRERDEFVVKIEDIETLKVALQTGKEPPAIWKVQKALLQKFVPEVRDGHREFAATNSYLGYFGDAKTKYKRVYVKFVENANKKEYVRVCSKKPRIKPVQSARTIHCKPSNSNIKPPDPPTPKPTATKVSSVKPKAKQPKVKAEPPPKKRKKWKEEFSSSQSDSSPEGQSEEDEVVPPAPLVTRFLNTRAMKETFKSYMELLVSIALDPDTMQALEKSNDELLLPHMRKIDGMLNDNRKRLLSKLRLDHAFKNALENFPELTVVTRDSKTKCGGTSVSKIKMNGKAYNKKTLRTSKSTTKSAQEFTVDPEKIQLYSLYHSLHHYKYHIYLTCKEEISSVQKTSADLGQEEIVQLCMKNIKWVEDLFEKFGELLNRVQQKCS